ncbi:hypothetical protein [Streptomyces sp. NPDC101455]|uniref:hypothetical protein n=1 Tax=Streptomyces sp. NPDC101455 TaxID=3366142 RepID=UPI00381397AD
MNGPFDAVMLSFDEPLADKLHARLQRILGMPVKRLHGVHGMRSAYRLAAETVEHEQFLLADGDFVLATEFDIRAVEPLEEGVSLRVWRAINPINGLVYGYGGLKLIRRSALRELGTAVDVLAALPGKITFTGEVAGTTRCNQSPYHAWKAGFRECAMLARGSEYGMPQQQATDRIEAWRRGGDGEFASFSVAGANEGVAFASEAAREPRRFDQLNDPTWLRSRFDAVHGEQVVVG